MKDDNPLMGFCILFAPLSLMAIGGGASILGDLHRGVVDQWHWLSNSAFLDIFAISRVAPGPGTLIVTLIGWKVAGAMGAVVATIAIFAPSSILVLGVARVWHSKPDAKWQRALIYGLSPLAAALVLSSVYFILGDARGGWRAWLVALLIGLTALRFNFGPILLMAVGAVFFYGLTLAFA
jgi:chromate transporter